MLLKRKRFKGKRKVNIYIVIEKLPIEEVKKNNIMYDIVLRNAFKEHGKVDCTKESALALIYLESPKKKIKKGGEFRKKK